MSFSVVYQSLSSTVVKAAANQETASLFGRLVTSFQSPNLAVLTLVVSTAIGAIFGFFAALIAYGGFQDVGQMFFQKPSLSEPVLLAGAGCSACLGLLTVFGINVMTSKLLKLPFSNSSTLAITLAALSVLGLGLLWKSGILSIVFETLD